MKIIGAKFTLAVALLGGSISSASAAGWEIWTEKQGGDKLTIVTSFGGDGAIEEAQVDLKINETFEVLDTQVLRKGSVCVASAEKNIVRSLPPSGAGSALKSATTDTCMFTLRVTSKKGWSPMDVVTVGMKECASSVAGVVSCDAVVKSVK